MEYPMLKKYMEKNNINVSELAKQCNIPQPTMWRIVNGSDTIKKSNIDAILRATGMTYEVCFSENYIESWEDKFLVKFNRVV